ncbi:WD repeat and HMG-box DNA binding-domain containing protein 1, partial [Branchiostoma belcheri]
AVGTTLSNKSPTNSLTDWNEKAKQMSNTSQDADLKKRKRESESEETFQGDDEGLKGENVGDKRLEDAGSQAKKKRPLSTSVNSKLKLPSGVTQAVHVQDRTVRLDPLTPGWIPTLGGIFRVRSRYGSLQTRDLQPLHYETDALPTALTRLCEVTGNNAIKSDTTGPLQQSSLSINIKSRELPDASEPHGVLGTTNQSPPSPLRSKKHDYPSALRNVERRRHVVLRLKMGTSWKELSLSAVLLLLCAGSVVGKELKCVCEDDPGFYRYSRGTHSGRVSRPSGPQGVTADNKRERVVVTSSVPNSDTNNVLPAAMATYSLFGKPDGPANLVEPGAPGVRGAGGKKVRSSARRASKKAHKLGVVGQIVGSRNNGLPAFTAVRSHDLAAMDGNIVITFDQTPTNVADDFDASSGVFVCQVSGVYYFSFGMRKAEGTDSAVLLLRNGRAVAMAHSTGRAGTEMLAQGAAIVLQAEDRVHTELRIGSVLDGSKNEPAIVFSGFLIQRK